MSWTARSPAAPITRSTRCARRESAGRRRSGRARSPERAAAPASAVSSRSTSSSEQTSRSAAGRSTGPSSIRTTTAPPRSAGSARCPMIRRIGRSRRGPFRSSSATGSSPRSSATGPDRSSPATCPRRRRDRTTSPSSSTRGCSGSRRRGGGGRARRVLAASAPGHTFQVEARLFVLALGGIENARLLLLSNDDPETGLGNRHDVVGRFFMDHPTASCRLIPAGPRSVERLALYDTVYRQGRIGQGILGLADETVRREGLLNSGSILVPIAERWSRALASTATLAGGARRRQLPVDALAHARNAALGADVVAAASYRRLVERVPALEPTTRLWPTTRLLDSLDTGHISGWSRLPFAGRRFRLFGLFQVDGAGAGARAPRHPLVAEGSFRTTAPSTPLVRHGTRAGEHAPHAGDAGRRPRGRRYRQARDDGRARGRGRHPGLRRPERAPSSGHDEDASRSRAGRRRRKRPGPRDVEPLRLRDVGVPLAAATSTPRSRSSLSRSRLAGHLRSALQAGVDG